MDDYLDMDKFRLSQYNWIDFPKLKNKFWRWNNPIRKFAYILGCGLLAVFSLLYIRYCFIDQRTSAYQTSPVFKPIREWTPYNVHANEDAFCSWRLVIIYGCMCSYHINVRVKNSLYVYFLYSVLLVKRNFYWKSLLTICLIILSLFEYMSNYILSFLIYV